MKRVKFNLNTTFITSLKIGKVIEYLNKENIPLRDAIEIALTCFYYPLAAASKGESIEQIKASIETSRAQFETYIGLAVSRAEREFNLAIEETKTNLSSPPKHSKRIKFEDEEL